MNSDIVELKRPARSLADMTDGEMLAALDEPVKDFSPVVAVGGLVDLETNTRLTIIRMMEQVPQMGQSFTFSVRKYCGPAYVQAMRTTLARARRYLKENNGDLGEPFRMLVLSVVTQPMCDVVTVVRVPKGQKIEVKLAELAKLLGSHVEDDDE